MWFQHVESKTFQDKGWSNPVIQTWRVSSYLVEVILFVVLFPLMRWEPAYFMRSPQSCLHTSNSMWELWRTFNIISLRSVANRRIGTLHGNSEHDLDRAKISAIEYRCIAVGNIKHLDRALTPRLVSNVSWTWMLEQGSLNSQTCH